MAGAAGHPDVAHAAASFGSLPGRRADAGLPADLGTAGPELVAERADLGFVFENRYRHENDHAQAGACSVLFPLSWTGTRAIRGVTVHDDDRERGHPAGVTQRKAGQVVSTRIDWVREHCRLLRAISAEFGRTRPFDGLTIGTGIHLEAKTVALLLTLRDGGARLVSTGNLNTTQPDAVDRLRAEGITVIGEPTKDSQVHAADLDEVLAAAPDLILDNGGDLFARYLDRWSSATAGRSTCSPAGTCSTWPARGRWGTPSSRWTWGSPCRPAAWKPSPAAASTPPAASSRCPGRSTRTSRAATWTGSTRGYRGAAWLTSITTRSGPVRVETWYGPWSARPRPKLR